MSVERIAPDSQLLDFDFKASIPKPAISFPEVPLRVLRAFVVELW
jgi:hypothetical protein